MTLRVTAVTRTFTRSLTHRRSAGWILNGGAVGQGLSDVVTAFVVSDPRFRSWLLEQVTAIEGVGAMSEKAKNSKLKAVGEKIRLRPGSPAMFLAEMLSAQATARGPR